MKKALFALAFLVVLSPAAWSLDGWFSDGGSGGSSSGSSSVGPGTSGLISKFTAATTIGDSNISDNGSTVTIAVPLVLSGNASAISAIGSSMTVTVAGSSYVQYASSYNLAGATLYNGVVASSMTVFNQTKYADFSSIDYIGSTANNAINVTSTSFNYGNALFSNSVSSETPNCIGYRWVVPEDIDTSVAMTVSRWKFVLGNTDTGTHRYVIAYQQVADSANPPAGSAFGGITASSPINVDFAGDASGASGDVETVSGVTLTSWAGSLVAGRTIVITVCRDGDSASDGSTVDSTASYLRISYGSTQ
jgi:hypothetical protein